MNAYRPAARKNLPWTIAAVASWLIIGLIAFTNWQGIKAANTLTRNAERAVLNLVELFSAVQDAESGQRGYLLTGQESYLGPYRRAISNIDELTRAVELGLGDGRAAKQDVARLKALVSEKTAELRQTIEIRDRQGLAAALAIVNTNRGSTLMEEIRATLTHLEAREMRLLEERSGSVEDRAQWGGIVMIAASSLLFGLLTLLNKRVQQERESALAASAAKSTFLANMSHELRTPLNAIIGYSEMLAEEAEDEGKSSMLPDLEKIRTAGKHLLSLINSILDLSKIEAGKMDLYLETFSISQLVKETATVIKPLADKNGNKLDVQIDPQSGAMHSDQTKVRQALYNLLSNACKFTQEGTIKLTVQRVTGASGARIVFTVQDTGLGMSSDQIGKVFQPFTQADASTTRKFGGTGLGLSITRRFVEMMDGTLTVESALGKGSTFRLDLPASAAANPSEPALTHLLPQNLPENASVILAIDDDPAVHDLLRRSLGRHSFRVESAFSGEEGIRMARRLRPTAITLDVTMPGMDGWMVLSMLKADRELRDIPVVMVTIVDNKNLGYTLGATDYLSKPIDREQLLAVLLRYRHAAASTALIVEDDADARAIVKRTLESEGWRVDEAENGLIGLERVSQRRPGVILLDLMMPEMDGFEFVSALRKRPDAKTIPIIVITAKDVSPAERALLNGQVISVLQKGGFQLEELLAEVGRLVTTRVQRSGTP